MAQQPGMKFFLGGVIHEDFAGKVLAALARAGVERLEISPYLPVTDQQPQQSLKRSKAPTLPPPPTIDQPSSKYPAKTRDAVLAVLRVANAPQSPAEVRAVLADRKLTPGAISTALWQLGKDKLIDRVGPGRYVLAGAPRPDPPTPLVLRRSRLKMEPGGLTEQIYTRLLAAKGEPVPRAELTAIAAANGRSAAISGTLDRLVRQGFATNPAYGMYAAVANPAAALSEKIAHLGARKQKQQIRKRPKAPTGSAPNGQSQSEFVLSILKAAHPKPVTRAKLKERFAARNMRGDSVSVALNYLKAERLVAFGPEAGVYTYVPPKA